MPAFQIRSTTRARPPARCNQKSQRPPGAPTRKLPRPVASSNANRSRMATLTARAFMAGLLLSSRTGNLHRIHPESFRSPITLHYVWLAGTDATRRSDPTTVLASSSLSAATARCVLLEKGPRDSHLAETAPSAPEVELKPPYRAYPPFH